RSLERAPVHILERRVHDHGIRGARGESDVDAPLGGRTALRIQHERYGGYEMHVPQDIRTVHRRRETKEEVVHCAVGATTAIELTETKAGRRFDRESLLAAVGEIFLGVWQH